MPRLTLSDNDIDPIDAAVDAAIEGANDDLSTHDTNADSGAGEGSLPPTSQDGGVSTDFDESTTQGDNGVGEASPGRSNQQQTSPVGTGTGAVGTGNAPPQQEQTQPRQAQADNQQGAPAIERRFGQRIRDDGRGNFIDDNGRVVAKAGAERRLYENARRLENDLINERTQAQQVVQTTRRMQEELQRARVELQQAQQTQQSEPAVLQQARQRGLQDNEIGLGLDMVLQLKTNPVQGVRRVLQAALAQGYNLKDLIGNVEGVPESGLEMGAVRHMLDERLRPITEREQQQQNEAQRQADAVKQYNAFVASHDHADKHMDLIANYVQRNPNLSPESAYYEIKMWAMQNGLDFSQPLAPQMQAKQQQTQQSVPQSQPPQQQTQQMPMLNGAGVNPNIAAQPHDAPAGANDDWDSIIESSMREAGMQLGH